MADYSPGSSGAKYLAFASFVLLMVAPAVFQISPNPANISSLPSAPIARPLKLASTDYCPTGVCSENWGGYAVTGATGSVSDVKGSWIVPSVSCARHGSSYAALWVGIDGYSSSTVEQTGIIAQCTNGRASYYAWYEFYPAGSATISGLTVSPGQKFYAEVSYSSSSNEFTTTIRNLNTGASYSTSAVVTGAQRSSGEWITERPEVCSAFCQITTLANFGTARFGADYAAQAGTNYASVNGVSGQISAFPNVAITMTSAVGSTLAQPSSLSSDGTSFYMTYR